MILLIIFFSSCNAPHDNPFDPLSPDYEDTDIIDSSSCIEVSARAINHASYGPLSVHALDIEATIIDTNGVDHVWVRLDTIEIGTLHTGENTQTWFRRLDETQLPNRGLGDLIGRTLTLYYLNDMGRVSDGVEFQLYRVLYEVPQTIFPDNDTLLTTKQPQLEWISYDADFSFTYSVKILHIVEGSTEGILVYSYEEIHSDSTTHTVGDSLTNAPDFMVWTVTVVDEFGNEARSLTANFRIDDNE
ncbi:MAG: hypothetical protein HQ568_08815 [Calditrichaeota bacterium]|nr:hypothetical protein [Calditrichota bacterium]